jgi:hypothetical protein
VKKGLVEFAVEVIIFIEDEILRSIVCEIMVAGRRVWSEE